MAVDLVALRGSTADDKVARRKMEVGGSSCRSVVVGPSCTVHLGCVKVDGLTRSYY